MKSNLGDEFRKIFSLENLEKPARFDLKLFEPVSTEYPCLSSYIDSIFEQLKAHYFLLGKLFQISADTNGIYQSTLVVNGAIVRSLNNYRGALWALGSGNPHVLYDCLRSQSETLAFLHYVNLHPNYIRAAATGERNHPDVELKITNVLTMINKLDEIHSGIRKDYDYYCDLVHPNPSSLYANIETINDKECIIALTTRTKMSDKEAIIRLKTLLHWTNWIVEETLNFTSILYGIGGESSRS